MTIPVGVLRMWIRYEGWPSGMMPGAYYIPTLAA
jgi:hypothetical protein